MDLSAVMAQNYLTWTNTQDVFHVSVRREGDRKFLATSARRHQVSTREAEESGGAYTTRDCVWNLPAATTREEPKIGDTLTSDDGRTWTVLQVDEAGYSTRWRLTCRDFGLTDGLTDLIDFWQPTGREDAAGGPVGEFLPLYQGVQAKVQELTGDQADELGLSGTAVSYRVFVARSVYVDSGMQVRWRPAAGEPVEILEVVSHEAPDSLNRLMAINCRKGLW